MFLLVSFFTFFAFFLLFVPFLLIGLSMTWFRSACLVQVCLVYESNIKIGIRFKGVLYIKIISLLLVESGRKFLDFLRSSTRNIWNKVKYHCSCCKVSITLAACEGNTTLYWFWDSWFERYWELNLCMRLYFYGHLFTFKVFMSFLLNKISYRPSCWVG